MRLHEGLDVAVSEISLVRTEQLSKLRVGDDSAPVIRVLEVVLLHVVADELGDIHPGVELILVPAGELPDVVGNTDRLEETGVAVGGHLLGLALGNTSGLLLELLEVGINTLEELNTGRTLGTGSGSDSTDLILDALDQ